MSRKLVSIIIPTYNSAEHVVGAIKSVFDQGIDSCEILVVDDGSTDNTVEALREFENSRDVRILRHPDGLNHGTCASRKLAIAKARGKYLAFLDADDRYLSGKLAKHVATLESHPAVALVHGPVVIEKLPGAEMISHQPGRPPQDWIGVYNPLKLGISLLRRNPVFYNSTVVCRASAVSPADLPERLVFQSEDHLLWTNMVGRGGYLFFYDPEPLTCYRIHPEQFTSKSSQIPGSIPLLRLEYLAAIAARRHRRIRKQWLATAMLAEIFNLIDLQESGIESGQERTGVNFWRSFMSLHIALAAVLRIFRGLGCFIFRRSCD